jgi:hypothetical protein
MPGFLPTQPVLRTLTVIVAIQRRQSGNEWMQVHRMPGSTAAGKYRMASPATKIGLREPSLLSAMERSPV